MRPSTLCRVVGVGCGVRMRGGSELAGSTVIPGVIIRYYDEKHVEKHVRLNHEHAHRPAFYLFLSDHEIERPQGRLGGGGF